MRTVAELRAAVPGARIEGFAGDLGFFGGWASALASVGPGSFYATAANANMRFMRGISVGGG